LFSRNKAEDDQAIKNRENINKLRDEANKIQEQIIIKNKQLQILQLTTTIEPNLNQKKTSEGHFEPLDSKNNSSLIKNNLQTHNNSSLTEAGKIIEDIKSLKIELSKKKEDFLIQEQVVEEENEKNAYSFMKKNHNSRIKNEKSKLSKLKTEIAELQDKITQEEKRLENSKVACTVVKQNDGINKQIKDVLNSEQTNASENIDYKNEYLKIKNEFEKMKNELAFAESIKKEFQPIQEQLEELGELIKEISINFSTRGELLYDFLVQISDICLKLHESKVYEARKVLQMVKTKLDEFASIKKVKKDEDSQLETDYKIKYYKMCEKADLLSYQNNIMKREIEALKK
jgi:hypothetical protein